ncbi:SH3 domain-containing protein [Streptomyces leeuwenhoekii]|jgi:hypothetical protein|uniref:SH3 domain-containing protein n=1 Tax=Streptomyces leeuwenhoekii TaxID=1437453 RepID=UPI0036A8AFB9
MHLRNVLAACASATVLIVFAGGPALAGTATTGPKSPTAITCTTYIALETVNIRSAPSTSGTVVGTLAQGAKVCGTTVQGDSYSACGVKLSATWVTIAKAKYVARSCLKG